MKKELSSFNSLETVLVITSFPNPADGRLGKRNFNAVSWHSQKTLSQLSQRRKVLVCAEKIGQKKYFKAAKDLMVVRLWQKGKLASFLNLLRFILSFDKVSSIFVQFEFNVFGGILPNLLLLGLLLFLKRKGKRITFELHQVIKDISLLEKHINIKNSFKQKFFNLGLRFYYLFLGLVVDKLIVFEEELKKRLKGLVKKDKIKVLSLAVCPREKMSLSKAKKKLGLSSQEFVVMAFGFINGYKGLGWLIKSFKSCQNKKNIRLLIAGGQNPYLKDKPFYQRFYQSILNLGKDQPQITYTGFIPDNQVGLYFSAADLVVLPYEVFISASGPFSLALSYQRPVIFSNKLFSYLKSADFKQSLKEAGLKAQEVFFPLKKEKLLDLIRKARKDKSFYHKLNKFSSLLAEKRTMEKVINDYENILFEKSLPLASLARLGLLGKLG